MLRPAVDGEANRLHARRLGRDGDDVGDEPAQSSHDGFAFGIADRLAVAVSEDKHLEREARR
jgi:hypothetical protein